MEQIKAPFTEDQVLSLIGWQQSPNNHPFTCCSHVTMFVHPDGFRCPDCGKVQNWAHSFMASPALMLYLQAGQMDTVRALFRIRDYDRELMARGVEPKREPDGDPLEHARWMCQQIPTFAYREPMKGQRWFGFLQSILWQSGVYSLADLKQHVEQSPVI